MHDGLKITRKGVLSFGEDPKGTAQYADAFAAAVPHAQVMRLQDANHYVFLTDEADVLQRINSFSSIATH